MYDVAVIGAGIVGAACAYELSKYNLRVAVLEKKNDVCCGTTKANSAIIHAGYDPLPGTLMARLNVAGSKMAGELCKKLDVPYQQIGSLVVAFSEDDKKEVEELYRRGTENGVEGLRIVDAEELRKMEPYISDQAICALYAPTAAIVNPWEYGIALAETAVRNGTEVKLEFEVTSIEKKDGVWHIESPKGSVDAKYVINAAGVDCDTIHNMVAQPAYKVLPSAGEYYLLDLSEGKRANHVIFQCPDKDGKGVLVTHTCHGNLLVGPNADPRDKDDTSTKSRCLDFIRQKAVKSVPSIAFRENIRNFTGVRAVTDRDDFIIEFAAEHFLDLAGIKSPGLSAAPAIALEAVKMLADQGLALNKKENIVDSRKHLRFKKLSNEEKNRIIAQDPAYGRVICRCETITEGEILDALRSPIPPVSLDDIKRRAGTGMGRCQSGFCGPKVLEIIAKFRNVPYEDVLQDDTGSYILTGETKSGGVK